MARPPSIRRRAMEIMEQNLRGIQQRQARATRDGKEYELTEREENTVLLAAKVAALLERTSGEEEEEKPTSPQEKAAALARLEKTGGPPTALRVARDDDAET